MKALLENVIFRRHHCEKNGTGSISPSVAPSDSPTPPSNVQNGRREKQVCSGTVCSQKLSLTGRNRGSHTSLKTTQKARKGDLPIYPNTSQRLLKVNASKLYENLPIAENSSPSGLLFEFSLEMCLSNAPEPARPLELHCTNSPGRLFSITERTKEDSFNYR